MCDELDQGVRCEYVGAVHGWFERWVDDSLEGVLEGTGCAAPEAGG